MTRLDKSSCISKKISLPAILLLSLIIACKTNTKNNSGEKNKMPAIITPIFIKG